MVAHEQQRRAVDKPDWARFDADMIARIKAALPLADLLPALGATKGRERGKWSCLVCGSSDGLQLYSDGHAHCYASCASGRDALDLLGAVYGADMGAKVRAGAQLARIDYEGERAAFLGREPERGAPAAPSLPAPVRRAHRGAPRWEQLADDAELLGHQRPDAEQFASAQLKDEARAVLVWMRGQVVELDDWAARWLEGERGLDPQMCLAFGLVSCTAPRWRELVHAAAGRFGADVVKVAGVMRAEDGEHHREGDPFPRVPRFIIMPNVIEGGAALDALRFRNPAPSSPHLKALALLNPAALTPGLSWALERPYLETWALEMARTHDLPLYVCEGELDALSMWQMGRPALAAPGAKSWRAGWCASWAGLSRVVVVADQDARAGAELAQSIGAAMVGELGRDEARRLLGGTGTARRARAGSGYKDPNDLLRAGELGAFVDECEAP